MPLKLWTLILTAIVSAEPAPLTDSDFLTQAIWNDGKAEIAFYQVDRDLNQYGQPKPQSFLMGTYLVKHEFDRARQSKARRDASGESSFKWAAFYEFESDNSYQYKRNYVVNAAQANLAPLKQSYTSFDWCSNQYRELAFATDGSVESWMRSDDYGNSNERFRVSDDAYPVTLIPLLVRALDFADSAEHTFELILDSGETVAVSARLEGEESLQTPAGLYSAERIRLDYGGDFSSFVSRRGARQETYWRARNADRPLLRIESGSYRVELIEHVRSPYWRENIYDTLKHVSSRP